MAFVISVPMPRFTNSHLELASLIHFLHNITQSSTNIFSNVRPLANCLLIKKRVMHVLLFGKVIAIFRIFFRLALSSFKMITEKTTFPKADNSLHWSSHWRCSEKFVNFTGKYRCWSLFLIKLQIPTQVFSGEICQMFKNTCFQEHLRTTTSENCFSGCSMCLFFWGKQFV